MRTTDTERRKVAWLIAIRAVISTVLLGSATSCRSPRPARSPIDPFFFLIGLIYALTIVYAMTLRLVERLPLAGRSCSWPATR